MTKTQDPLMMTLNETDGSTAWSREYYRGKDAGDFRGYISYNSGATLASTTRGWVIKKVNTKLPSGKITSN